MSEALPHFLCCRFLLSERHQIQHVLELSVGKKKKTLLLCDYSHAT